MTSAEDVVASLIYAERQPYFATFLEQLRTVRTRARVGGRSIRLRAKTGTLGYGGVKALAGYADYPNGARVAFTVVFNCVFDSKAEVRRRLNRYIKAALEAIAPDVETFATPEAIALHPRRS